MASKPNQTKSKNTKSSETGEAGDSPLQKKILLEWAAPIRPYRKLDKEVFSTILAGAFLLGVILFFIDGAVPVIALASIVFLFYVLGNVPPGQVHHTITNWGIESEDKSWPWETMARYWLQGKGRNRMLVIQLASHLPQHIRFMLGDMDEKKLHDLLQDFLTEDKPQPNWLDKSSKWLESKIRLTPDGAD